MRQRALEAETLCKGPEGTSDQLREVGSARTDEIPTSSRVRVDSGDPVGPAVAVSATTIMGEVVETHHPLMLGCVLVAWVDADGERVQGWLQRERHLSLRTGDRVLLSLLGGLNEWVVTGALGGRPSSALRDAENERQLRLQPGESVRLIAHDGQPLLTVHQGPTGPVIELGAGDVELKAERTLRLNAETVEVRANNDIELRSERDTIVRGRYIRLN